MPAFANKPVDMLSSARSMKVPLMSRPSAFMMWTASPPPMNGRSATAEELCHRAPALKITSYT